MSTQSAVVTGSIPETISMISPQGHARKAAVTPGMLMAMMVYSMLNDNELIRVLKHFKIDRMRIAQKLRKEMQMVARNKQPEQSRPGQKNKPKAARKKPH